jgi:hypothetical protein
MKVIFLRPINDDFFRKTVSKMPNIILIILELIKFGLYPICISEITAVAMESLQSRVDL